MSSKKDIETKEMLGSRFMNSDGFTYVSGKYKSGYKKRKRNAIGAKRSKRSDKRGAKNKTKRRIKKETLDN